MYLPKHFDEAREEELLRTVAAYPLGALVVNGPNGLDANHVPFLIDEASKSPRKLLAHVARANPLCKETKDGEEVLVIFRAEDAYVSPNWYPSKHDFHKQVPTWNYRVVHVHGRLYISDDERFDIGPGYRVYYSQRGTVLLLLLAGGDKSTQEKDIAIAIALARGFKE